MVMMLLMMETNNHNVYIIKHPLYNYVEKSNHRDYALREFLEFLHHIMNRFSICKSSSRSKYLYKSDKNE